MCISLYFTEDRVIYIWGIPTRKAFDPYTKNKQSQHQLLIEENQNEDEAKVKNIKVGPDSKVIEETKKTKAMLNYPHAQLDIIPGMEHIGLKLSGPTVKAKSNCGPCIMVKHSLSPPILKWKMMAFHSHAQVGAFSVLTYLFLK